MHQPLVGNGKYLKMGKVRKLVLHILPPAPQSKIKIVSSVQSASAVNNYVMVQLFVKMIRLCSTVNWHLQPEQHYSVRGFYQLVKWSVILYSKAPSQWAKVLKRKRMWNPGSYPVRRRLAVQNDAFPTLSICHSCLWRGNPCDASRQAGGEDEIRGRSWHAPAPRARLYIVQEMRNQKKEDKKK